MIFGNPYRFAIWVEDIPMWGGECKNGLFYLVINGSLYPDDIRTATLSTDLYEITSAECALMSLPENDAVFNMPTEDAFDYLFKMAHPESTDEDEYPIQVFDYCILSSNVSDYGGRFFAVASNEKLRIIGGRTEHLVQSDNEDRNVWKEIKNPSIEDVIMSKYEIGRIMDDLRKYIDKAFVRTK